jgi:DNA polymerase-3 subunit epsilon
MNTYAVIDFETTGLSPDYGARPTEIAVVLVRKKKIVDRYQSLMNPEVPIPYFIQEMTGITNEMVIKAPKISDVMREASSFVRDYPILAHNATFDKKFWDYELRKLKIKSRTDFACSLLLARRLFPSAPNHKLATLVKILGIPKKAGFHRALADAEYTAHLLVCIQRELEERYKLTNIDHQLLLDLQSIDRNKIDKCIQKYNSHYMA